MKKADIGLVGLAVMGENLVMNMESKGFTVAVYNRTVSKVDNFVNGRGKGKNIIGCHSLEELISQLEKPRKVFMMVKAGTAVDDMIHQLLPLLEDGDIPYKVVDDGQSLVGDIIKVFNQTLGRDGERLLNLPAVPFEACLCNRPFPVYDVMRLL